VNAAILAQTIRDQADKVQNQKPRRETDFDTAELLRVLARVIEGKPLAKAFGAPGDWGYSHPIAKAMLACADCGKPHRDCECGEKTTEVRS
jgi:hypothetical protein